jgi:hypothetical protein
LTGRFRSGVPAPQLVDSASPSRPPGTAPLRLLRPRLRFISALTGRFRSGVPASGHACASSQLSARKRS